MSSDLSAMMDTLANGGGLESVLEQLIGSDPVAARLVAMMKQRQALSSPEPPVTIDTDPQGELRTLQCHILKLEEQLNVLGRRNTRFAHALGACECFGEAPQCPLCQGAGGAGLYRVNRPLFDTMVAPAVAQLHQRRVSATLSKEEQPWPTTIAKT